METKKKPCSKHRKWKRKCPEDCPYKKKTDEIKKRKIISDNKPIKEYTCQTCDKKDHQEKMIVCEQCNQSFHFWCLQYPISRIPIEKWYCCSCHKPLILDEKCIGCDAFIIEDATHCYRCGIRLDPKEKIRDVLLWKEAENTIDSYTKESNDSNKFLTNYFFSNEIKEPIYGGNIFILDGNDAGTYKAISKTMKAPFYRVICANNTQSALVLKEIYKNRSYISNFNNEVIPLSAQDYFSEHYSDLYPIPKEGFYAVYLDFCGQYAILEELENVFHHLSKICMFGLTLQKRSRLGEQNVLEKTKKWIEENAGKNNYNHRLLVCYEYGNMFTVFYEFVLRV